MLLTIELLVLIPSLRLMARGLSLMDLIDEHRDYVERAYRASATDSLPAAMAVVCSSGQRYQGTMLLQPLVQLLLPVVQHVLEGSAAQAAALPAAHDVVHARVALVTFTSHLLLRGIIAGETRVARAAFLLTLLTSGLKPRVHPVVVHLRWCQDPHVTLLSHS